MAIRVHTPSPHPLDIIIYARRPRASETKRLRNQFVELRNPGGWTNQPTYKTMSDNTDSEARGDTVDLPDHMAPDRCVIDSNPAGRRPFIATPYRTETTAQSDNEFLTEYTEMPPEWEPSAEYVAYVRENADVDGEIKFLRNFVAPVTEDAILEEPVHDGGDQ